MWSCTVITFYLVSITPGPSAIQLVLSDLLILLCPPSFAISTFHLLPFFCANVIRKSTETGLSLRLRLKGTIPFPTISQIERELLESNFPPYLSCFYQKVTSAQGQGGCRAAGEGSNSSSMRTKFPTRKFKTESTEIAQGWALLPECNDLLEHCRVQI